MKKSISLLMAALMVLAAVSCDKGNNDEPEIVEPKPSVKTQEATEIDAYSARFHAQIDFAGIEWGGVNYGFFWGTSEDAEGTYIQAEGDFDESGAYSAKITGLTPETAYWFKAFAEIDGEPFAGEILHFTTAKIPVPEAVDLGIVVNGKKIKWASFNLGATKPEENGYFYSWGETAPKDDYIWSTYKFGTSSSGPFSKYNSVDMVLDPGPEGDDVASKYLGGKWRMPTQEEWTELITKCTSTKTPQNGKNGLLVTATNGKSIFLPFAGFTDRTYHHNEGESAHYWSSSLGPTTPAYAYNFVYGVGTASNVGQSLRNLGYSVRPIYEE